MRGVSLGDISVDLQTFGHLVLQILGAEDDAHGQYVIDILERYMLGLHLLPDAVGALDAGLDGVLDAVTVQFGLHGGDEVAVDGFQVVVDFRQTLADEFALLGVLVAEAEVFQLFLNLIQSQAIGQRGVDVQRFAGYLVLFVGWLAAQRAHVVQAVGNLDEDDADVVAHGQEQFLQVLDLGRRFVAKDAARDFRQSIDNLCYLGTEDVLDVGNGVVGVLDNVVQQG